MSPRLMAMLLMVISSVGISFGGLIVRSMEVADAWHISFYRSVGYATTVGLVLLWRYRSRVPAQIRAVGRAGLLAGLLSACAAMGFLQSLVHSSVATTLFIMAAIPFVTAAVAWIVLRERLAPVTIVTMGVAAIGVVIMVSDGITSGSLYGTLMALVTVMCFSGYAVVLRRGRGIDMVPVLLISSLSLATVAGIVRWDDLAIPWRDILLCLLLGGILSGFGNLMFLAASRQLAAAELTFFMLLEFALGPVWVWLFISETPTRAALVGGAMVVTAVMARALVEHVRRPAARP